MALKHEQETYFTFRKISLIHNNLPILHLEFLKSMIRCSLKLAEEGVKMADNLSVFSLNISHLKIYDSNDQELISLYESAFALEMNPQQFNANYLIGFLFKHSMFAKHGFYKGFGRLLFNIIVTDPKLGSD